MAKNHEKFEYYDVAVPRTNTLLLRYLQETYENTNTPGSQLLVQLATERVKQLFGDGQVPLVSGLGSLQGVLASMIAGGMSPSQVTAPTSNGTASAAKPPTAVQPLGYDLMRHGADEEDLENYGDPD